MTVEPTLTIDRRFCGPTHSGNGGYTCGRLAAFVNADDAVQVTLRLPPPLDTLMRVRRDADGARLYHGQQLVAEAVAAKLSLTVPKPPNALAVQAAARRYAGHDQHAFPRCFVCGPEREPGDGLRIFTGPVGRDSLVAGPWTPDPSLGDDSGLVKPAFLWAAIDCAGSWAPDPRPDAPIVLGRFTTRLHRSMAVGETGTVIGWPLGVDGRKYSVGSALFNAEGALVASAQATWIAVKPAA